MQDIQNWPWMIIPHGEKREKIEDDKWVIRSRKSKNNTTEWLKDKGQRAANNDLQNTTHKTKKLPLVFTFSIDKKYAL